jgi:hypothetical protein
MVVGQLFSRIDKKYGEGRSFFFHQLEQGLFLEAVCFTAQPFDAVSVHRLFKMPAAGAEAGLQRGFRRRRLK